MYHRWHLATGLTIQYDSESNGECGGLDSAHARILATAHRTQSKHQIAKCRWLYSSWPSYCAIKQTVSRRLVGVSLASTL